MYGAVLGRPAGTVTGLHTLAWLGSALWIAGLAITWLTVG